MIRFLVVLILAFITTPALAKVKKSIDANGNTAGACYVVSQKTGAKARVGCAHQMAFQSYVSDLENNGAVIKFMGGIRRGKCWSGGLHPCGKAIDVCQLRRGVVDKRCHLPARHELAIIAARHGLFEGGRWCSSDYGHAQIGATAGDCSTRISSARSKRHKVASR